MFFCLIYSNCRTRFTACQCRIKGRFPLEINVTALYNRNMIMTIRDNRTKKLYAREVVNGVPKDVQKIALRKLRLLNSARYLNDLRVPPTNKLARLLGKREGQYNIRVTDEWRICFEWHQCHSHNVELVHYQKDNRGQA